MMVKTVGEGRWFIWVISDSWKVYAADHVAGSQVQRGTAHHRMASRSAVVAHGFAEEDLRPNRQMHRRERQARPDDHRPDDGDPTHPAVRLTTSGGNARPEGEV